ncbi:MAG: STAS/SEC14 domain-containing protein [Chloroflexi bacterium]|nr:STAS/SEC14 domain-containing protein [Chloroflexota bacterium]
MPTISIQSEIPLETLLHGVAQLDTNHLEQFTRQVLALRAQRRAPHLSHREVELLQQINEGLPTPMQSRLQELVEQQQEGGLTAEAQQELLTLIAEVEERDALRLNLLGELAQLRGVSLREVMAQLGLRPTYA